MASRNPSSKSFLYEIHEIAKFVHNRIVEQNKKMGKYTNKSRNPRRSSIDDKVWLSTKNLSIEDPSGIRKLHSKFCGPFNIKEKINYVSFRLESSEPMKERKIHDVFHSSLFKPFVPDKYGRYDQPLPPVNIQDGEEEYEVEAILDSKKIRRTQHFLVKWKG